MMDCADQRSEQESPDGGPKPESDKLIKDVECEDNGEEKKPALSKSQLKKLKKKEKWEQVKAQKRKAEKERYKARKRACIERGEDFGPTRKQLKHNKMSKSQCKVQVVVDCDFDEYMAEKCWNRIYDYENRLDPGQPPSNWAAGLRSNLFATSSIISQEKREEFKDINMLVKQIQFSYSANRRVLNPMQFHCCGVGGKTKQRLESLSDYKGWDINFHGEGYLECFDKQSVVYLSSESPNVLTTLDDDKVYIIGGLVDHNHQKGLCHRLAEEKGVAHAQLPISDYIDMKTRKVLTINHVFEILLNYTETRDWQKSFYKVLPPRKGAVPKADISSEKGDKSSDNDKLDSSNKTTAESDQGRELTSEKKVEKDSVCDKPESQEEECVKSGTLTVSEVAEHSTISDTTEECVKSEAVTVSEVVEHSTTSDKIEECVKSEAVTVSEVVEHSTTGGRTEECVKSEALAVSEAMKPSPTSNKAEESEASENTSAIRATDKA